MPYRQPTEHELWQRTRNYEIDQQLGKKFKDNMDGVFRSDDGPRKPGWGDHLQATAPTWAKALFAVISGATGTVIAAVQGLPLAAVATIGIVAALIGIRLPLVFGNLFQGLLKLVAVIAVLLIMGTMFG